MKNEFGSPLSGYASGTTSASSTVSGVAGKTYYVTDIAVSSDLAGAIMTIKDGNTTIFSIQLGANNPFQHNFNTPLKITAGNDLVLSVNGTSACYVNMAGFSL